VVLVRHLKPTKAHLVAVLFFHQLLLVAAVLVAVVLRGMETASLVVLVVVLV
jgi:hypothetical protein